MGDRRKKDVPGGRGTRLKQRRVWPEAHTGDRSSGEGEGEGEGEGAGAGGCREAVKAGGADTERRRGETGC